MKGPTLKTVVLTVLAFILVSFVVQAISQFVLNADHYASIPIMRPEPIMPLGIAAMVVQGLLLGILFPATRWADGNIRAGVLFSWALGAFLAAYIVLVEPAKYLVPSVSAWMGVEGAASFVQFTVFGVLLAYIHRPGRSDARAGAL